MANLGEISNRLGLAVPRGFAITATAYKAFMEEASLVEAIASRLDAESLADLERLQQASQDIQDLVLKAPLPADLEQILRLAARALPTDRLAVRSSAVGEDTEYSFAGQFATLLNVPVEDLPTYYKGIVASKFTSQALFYWKHHDFSIHELPMAVGVLAMVPAKASGVMFSLDPHEPASARVIINAVWGLGKFAVDGTITPDLYVVDRARPHRLLRANIADKPKALRCGTGGGCEEVNLPVDLARMACLTEVQLESLAEMALALENHFGGPQDIEWALDENDNIVLLQSRPLRISAPASGPAEAGTREQIQELAVAPIINHGVRAAGGVAAGQVYFLGNDRDLDQIPDGAVVLARQPSARLVLVMDRINAIITETGSPTDHMTILAREFRLPTLVEVGGEPPRFCNQASWSP
jgi:pyruvate,water dikinase